MGKKLIGPFRQLLTMNNMHWKGALKDEQLEIIENGGLLIEDGIIVAVGKFEDLAQQGIEIEEVVEDLVLIPGLVDAHTHLCFAGSRAKDYALRVSGKTYLEISQSGGGILDTVKKTREASEQELVDSLKGRLERVIKQGITTCEIKSGYGLNVADEIKMLRAIAKAQHISKIDLVATCLAAHMKAPEFHDKLDYLDFILEEILPMVKHENLAKRVDIFIEKSAFTADEGHYYLAKAAQMGFGLTVHADQFSTGGSEVAVEANAQSADHLEASGEREIEILASSDVVSVALPGASLGLGMAFTPARKILNAGGSLAIASDWNPGSAPMGDLLTQAAVLGTFEKLSMSETLSGITHRAALALGLPDRGILATGKIADFIAFPCSDYREILYHQGSMKPVKVWKKGDILIDN